MSSSNCSHKKVHGTLNKCGSLQIVINYNRHGIPEYQSRQGGDSEIIVKFGIGTHNERGEK